MRERRSVYLRRRATALGVVAVLALGAGAAAGGGGGDAPGARDRAARPATAVRRPPPELPGGGRRIFPDRRVVAFYGAPQARELGALGIGTPDQAAARLARQARHYARGTRPVLPAFELLAVIANRDAGADGLYRTRQPDAVVRRYLRAARRHRALLILDIQPGHGDFLAEARHLAKWLRQPDVGIALDPEWHTPGAVPGTVIGSVSAGKVNEVARYVADIVRRNRLPEKLFVVHQFTEGMVQGKPYVARPPGLAVTFNVDGFGTRAAKVSKYRLFTRQNRRAGFHDGFKLFYEEDTGLMPPRRVLRLHPPPDLVVYE
ncbi:MAG TPA: hypothetical protein VLB47_05880 [Solirubrobacteraceae bacterium]|nr:hypothetical protein [Solirubrobacteraceae bacterium]